MKNSGDKFKEEINAEEELKLIKKVLKTNMISLGEKEDEPRNVFKTFNVDDLDRLIDFEDNN